jgi:hypothetical protein
MGRPLQCIALLSAALLSACGSGSGTPPRSGTPSSQSNATKIYLLVLENQSYEQVVGSPNLPYLNSLIASAAVSDSSFANTHPSIGNYFMLTTGSVVTNDDSFSGRVSADNLVRELTNAGRSWRVYADGLPANGYTGGDTGSYLKRHNPFAYLSDVVNDPAQAQHLVTFDHFQPDIESGNSANFNFVLPDRFHDMHDCPGLGSCTDDVKQKTGDAWLQANLQPLLASADFRANGLLILTFDESTAGDTLNGGGHVLTILLGPKTRSGFRSKTLFQHQSTLRLICDLLGCPADPGASASAPPMNELLH